MTIPSDFHFNIEAVGNDLNAELQLALDAKTKPPGSLGALEILALQLGNIQKSLTPEVCHPTLLIFAGDHGITAEQVSPYTSDVTAQMVRNFLAGGAAANVLARQACVDLVVVDAGVSSNLPDHSQLIRAKIGLGTRNFRHESAMSLDECKLAITRSSDIVRDLHARGVNTLALGEMGIGNSSAASCLMSRLTGLPIESCVGRGAGLSDTGLKHKLLVLAESLERTSLVDGQDPLEILAAFGGYEIAMLTGAMLAAASHRMVLVIDGFIVTTALLVATKINARVLDYCVFAHQSAETGHALLLKQLNAKPLLNLQLRLGEGSGALLAMPLIRSALAILREMATFEEANIRRDIRHK
jgi:nicotinate-nucleotide--dimethylbenzimidazole phosphoribosyltransferase